MSWFYIFTKVDDFLLSMIKDINISLLSPLAYLIVSFKPLFAHCVSNVVDLTFIRKGCCVVSPKTNSAPLSV